MKLFDKSASEKIEENPLAEALFEYSNALERGIYNSLDSYNRENFNWTDADEVDLVQYHLKPFLQTLKIDNIHSQSIGDELQKIVPIDFPKIAHLIYSLKMLKDSKKISPEKQLDSLRKTEILTRVEAGMPVPCIAYLAAIRNSELSDRIKLQMIKGVITKIENNLNSFGCLGNIALKTAICDWVTLAQKSSELSEKKKNKISDYQNILRNIPSEDIVENTASLIEKYTLLACEKINVVEQAEKCVFDSSTHSEYQK